tara:strand:+ start:144 stop:440 length:297 start_codon:yes stop_codon:yes gene_type:complete
MAFKMKYSKDGFPYKSPLTVHDGTDEKHDYIYDPKANTKVMAKGEKNDSEDDFTEREKNKVLKEKEKESSGTSPRPKEKKIKLPTVSLKKDDLIKKPK